MARIYRLQFAHVAVPVLSFDGVGAADCYSDVVDVEAVVDDWEDRHRLVLVVDADLLLLEELLLLRSPPLKLLRRRGCSGSWEGVVVVELHHQPAFPLLQPCRQVRVEPRWQPDSERL